MTLLVSNFQVGFYRRRADYVEETRYGLYVTNLDESEITFAVDFYVSCPAGEPAPLAYVSSALQADGVGLRCIRKRAVVLAQGRLQIPSRMSALVKLRKTLRDDRELAGFVVLRVPSLHASGTLRLGPQVDHDVRVLLHARREDTRPARSVGISTHEGYVAGRTGTGDNHSSEAIAIASGRAENHITPDGQWRFSADEIAKFGEQLTTAALASREEETTAGLVQEDERLPALVELLHGLSGSSAPDMNALNNLLARQGVDVRLQRSKRRG